MKDALLTSFGLVLLLLTWLFLGVFALGDRFVQPIPRARKKDDYL